MKRIKRGIAILVAMFAALVCLTAVSAAADVVPVTPSLSSAKLTSANSAKITWKAATNAKKYELYCSTNGGGFKKLTTTTGKSYTHKNLPAGATFTYKLKALNGKKKSGFSSTKKIKTISSGKTNLASSVSGTAVTLKWSKVKNATGYYVYQEEDSEFKLIGDTRDLIFKTVESELATAYKFKVVPYISGFGKTCKGSASTTVVTTDREAYLLDINPPYQSSHQHSYVFNNYNNRYFYMGGEAYTHGFTCTFYGSTFFNLKGKYKKLTFISGPCDNKPERSGVEIYGDGELIYSYSVANNQLPQAHSVNVENCLQLEIRVIEYFYLDHNECGFANIKVSV